MESVVPLVRLGQGNQLRAIVSYEVLLQVSVYPIVRSWHNTICLYRMDTVTSFINIRIRQMIQQQVGR